MRKLLLVFALFAAVIAGAAPDGFTGAPAVSRSDPIPDEVEHELPPRPLPTTKPAPPPQVRLPAHWQILWIWRVVFPQI